MAPSKTMKPSSLSLALPASPPHSSVAFTQFSRPQYLLSHLPLIQTGQNDTLFYTWNGTPPYQLINISRA